jgi:hypothetical protein
MSDPLEQVCKVCGKPLVFKGYYSDGSPDFIGENWDCEDECNEEDIADDDEQ